MATVWDRKLWTGLDVIILTWNLTDGETGDFYERSRWGDTSVQIYGTFGGATAVVEGANYYGNPFYMTLIDALGVPISATGNAFYQILTNSHYIRPRVIGGASSNITVAMVGRRH